MNLTQVTALFEAQTGLKPYCTSSGETRSKGRTNLYTCSFYYRLEANGGVYLTRISDHALPCRDYHSCFGFERETGLKVLLVNEIVVGHDAGPRTWSSVPTEVFEPEPKAGIQQWRIESSLRTLANPKTTYSEVDHERVVFGERQSAGLRMAALINRRLAVAFSNMYENA
jgi:hypothetical protein